ncbi:hypothetical protein MFIFM68171_09053 [Madurella fahalii]|uniref:Uncharacterized protein n=1 Tax=Madurella fahalii TaxID=1157608 RepID=A0ABQ0GM66_9PEZI
MDPAEHARLGEKARLRDHITIQGQHDQQQLQPLQPSPAASSSRSPTSGSNSVPMTEEELRSSPVHNPHVVLLPSNIDITRSPTPPPYSGPSTPAQEPIPSPQAPKAPPRYPGLPPLDYRLYNPPLFDLSADKTTIRTTVPYLSTNADALVSLIRQQATVPPKPQIHIVGRRGSSPTSGRIDFSIKLNLLPLLVPEDPRQRMDYLRCVGPGEVAFRGGSKPSTQPEATTPEGDDGGLEAWAARYVADAASVKSFALERVVANLDVHWLEGQIRALVAGMRYPGAVAVSFPVTHCKVVVQNPDKVNKFFTSVTGFFAGKKKYEVIKAVWPFATMQRTGEGGRKCVVQSEEVWWREWREPIRYAIATKRHGWVTNEDKLEALMEGPPPAASTVDWGPDGSV